MCDIKKPMLGIQDPLHMVLKGSPLQKYVPRNPFTPPKVISDMKMKVYNQIPDNKTKTWLAAADPLASGIKSPIGVYKSTKDFGRDGSENVKTVRNID